MSACELDLLYLKCHSYNFLSTDNIPDDKKWLLVYCNNKEKYILIFYSIAKGIIPDHLLMSCYRNFTGKSVYGRYFYDTIDKYRYLLHNMELAKADINLDKIAEMNSGKFYTNRYLSKVVNAKISFIEAKQKYPYAVCEIENYLRSSCHSKFKDEPLEDFKWYISKRLVNQEELVCKRGTKLALYVKI